MLKAGKKLENAILKRLKKGIVFKRQGKSDLLHENYKLLYFWSEKIER